MRKYLSLCLQSVFVGELTAKAVANTRELASILFHVCLVMQWHQTFPACPRFRRDSYPSSRTSIQPCLWTYFCHHLPEGLCFEGAHATNTRNRNTSGTNLWLIMSFWKGGGREALEASTILCQTRIDNFTMFHLLFLFSIFYLPSSISSIS